MSFAYGDCESGSALSLVGVLLAAVGPMAVS